MPNDTDESGFAKLIRVMDQMIPLLTEEGKREMIALRAKAYTDKGLPVPPVPERPPS